MTNGYSWPSARARARATRSRAAVAWPADSSNSAAAVADRRDPHCGRIGLEQESRARQVVPAGGGIAARGRDLGDRRVRDSLHEPACPQRERLFRQPPGVVPEPGAEHALRRVGQQQRAVAGAEPERPAGLDAVEREARGLVDPAGLVDAVTQVHVGTTDVVRLLQLERDRERLAQAGLARVVLATAGETRAERVERLPLLGTRADRAGDARAPPRSAVSPDVRARGASATGPRPRRRARVRRWADRPGASRLPRGELPLPRRPGPRPRGSEPSRSCTSPARTGSRAASSRAAASRASAIARSRSATRFAASAARRVRSIRSIPARASASSTRSQTSSA